MHGLIFALIIIAAVFALAIWRAPLWAWALAVAAVTYVLQFGWLSGEATTPALSAATLFAWLPAALIGLLSVPVIRRVVLIAPAFAIVRKILPSVSETEQQALQAGTVGWDAELFSGNPDWAQLLNIPKITLTAEERSFLDTETEELCAMIDDWEIRHFENEIPQRIWDYVKEKGFLGMLISREHGGLGFSAQAQSLILGKISSRSTDVSTIVMVPNSLGPGELIEKYGTDQQKHHYLPRLAKGVDVPCFGLTGPTSGSDAATMRDIGTVTRGMHEGQEVIGIRLTFDKRYITLAPVATLVGLAFQLFDPDKLIGEETDIGITVALVPADHEGVKIGRRHLPASSSWPNGPISGEDVFIPLDWVIGGEAMVGQGWRMLMECLSAGRAISLPSSSTAGAKQMLRFTSAYARIRKQFGIPIGFMDGIEEPLARLVENAYVNEAARAVTASMVSRGEKPSVISALMKYQTTTRLRNSINDAMDIHAGKAVCDGPSNYLFGAYKNVPVGITVEGANILTRSLITFSQGALRAHPYLFAEVQAAQDPDRAKGQAAFERAFLGHVSFAIGNLFGALFHNVTGGSFVRAPRNVGGMAAWYRQAGRAARNFALVADLTVALLGGGLKIKQKTTGRLADALSELFMLTAILKRFEDDGRPAAEAPIVAFCGQSALYRFQEQLKQTVDNFPVRWARPLMRICVFPFGTPFVPPSDGLGKAICKLVLEPGEVRDRMTRDIFVSKNPDDPTGLLEITMARVIAAEAIERKVERAVRKEQIMRYHDRDWLAEAVEKAIITTDEAVTMREVDALVARVIAVDHFDPAELKPNYRKISNVRSPSERVAAAE